MENPFEQLSLQIQGLEFQLKQIKRDIEEIKGLKSDATKGVLTVGMAANFLNLSKASVYKGVSVGLIPCHKQGKRLYFFVEELEQWIRNGKRKTVAELKDEVRDKFSRQ